MNILSIGGLLLGLYDRRQDLKKVINIFREKVTDFDSFYELLQKIARKTIKAHVRRRLTLGENVGLIGILEENILKGEVDNARKNIAKLFQLSEYEIETIIKDFQRKIIKSNSDELKIALDLFSIQKINDLNDKVSILNEKIEKEEDLKESFEVIIELTKQIIETGEISKAYEYICRINLDNLKGYNSFRENLILIESDLILILGLKNNYSIQIRKLKRLSRTFPQLYYLLILKRKERKKGKFNVDDFIIDFKVVGFEKEIRILNDLIENDKFLINIDEIDKLDKNAQLFIVKQLLVNLINTSNYSYANQIIKKYKHLLTDIEARIRIVLNKLNEFHQVHPFHLLSKTEYELLDSIKSELLRFENYYKDQDNKIKSTFYYNLAITLCRLKDKNALMYYKKFREYKKLVLGFLDFLRIARFLEEALQTINSSKFKGTLEFLEKWIQIKFDLNHFSDIASLNNIPNDISIELKIKILLSRNIVKFIEKESKFNEKDVLLFESDIEKNIPIYILLSRLFHFINKYRLSRKYYKLSLKFIDKLTTEVKIKLVDLAIFLEDLNKAKTICKELFSEDPYSKVLFAKILQKETNNFNRPSIEANNFFSEITTDIILLPELFWFKSEYLFKQGEKDRSVKIIEWLVNNYDEDLDWHQYIKLLLDLGELEKVKKLIPVLEIKTQTPVILFTLAISYLFTDTFSKLEKFSKYYFKAEKKLSEYKNKIPEVLLIQPWLYIINYNLYIRPLPEYIKENVFVRLKNKTANEQLLICIHSDPSLAVPFDIEYMGCKHLLLDDPILKEIKFKKPVTFRYTEKNKEVLIKRNVPEDVVNCLEVMKDKDIIDEENLQNKLHELLTEYSQLKYIPIIMNVIDRIYDEATINGQKYLIEHIDYIWNYPPRHIIQIIHTCPEKFGLEKIYVESDPLIGIMPKLEKTRNYNKRLLNGYLSGNISFFVFTHHNYEHYVGGITKLLFEKENSLLGGLGIDFQVSNYAISYSSLLILFLFDKLQYLPIENLIISNTLINEVRRINWEIISKIPIEEMSISLDDDLILRKLIINPETKLEQAKKWNDFMQQLKQCQEIITTEFEDKYTPFVPLMGKLEIDSIRISQHLKVPLIIDDEYIRKIIKNTTNFLPFYFFYSTESYKNKLSFLNELSKLNYRYIIFQNFITTCINYFSNIDGLIIGPSTPFNIFLDILKRELSIKYPINLSGEIFRGIKAISVNYLKPNSYVILKELLLCIPNSVIKEMRFPLLYYLPDIQAERNFLRACLSDIEKENSI